MHRSPGRSTRSEVDDADVLQGPRPEGASARARADHRRPCRAAQRTEGRPARATRRLLLKSDGTRWQEINKSDHWDIFRAVAARAGFDPDEITSYALRHSSICRALLKGVPVSMVAKLHDTSSREIEAHYAAYILDVAGDALSRKALLQTEPLAAADNVVALRP